MYEALVQFGMDNDGDCNAPSNHIATLSDQSEVKLGHWLRTQRQSYKVQRLSQARLDLLQKLVDQNKLSWDVTKISNQNRNKSNNTTWEKMYNQLVAYGNKHGGNCNLPHIKNILPSNIIDISLYHWLNNQKRHYRNGTLNSVRFKSLQILVKESKLQLDTLKISNDSNR